MLRSSEQFTDRKDFTNEQIVSAYRLEFKVDKPVEAALLQMEGKDYSSIYQDSGKKMVEIGVVFSREKWNIIEWAVR